MTTPSLHRPTAGDGRVVATGMTGTGARDVLVFRRVAPGSWAHVGGYGRGDGWAGIVEAERSTEPLLHQALDDPAPVRVLAASSARIVGPYYACTAVLLHVTEDVVVVWGHPERSEALMATPADTLREASLEIADAVTRSTVAQRLGDELEVLGAVQRITGGLGRSFGRTLEHVADVTADAMLAQVVVVWTGDGRCAVADTGSPERDPAADVADPRDGTTTAHVLRIARDLLARHPGGVVVQDAATAPLPVPLSPQDGVTSYLLHPLGEDLGGGLLAVFRGSDHCRFNDLCRRMAVQIADAATVLLQVAQGRDQLEGRLDDIRARLERDTLTGVASRHRWEEELLAVQELVDTGVPVTVALVDLDELKEVNDTHGHAAGDELLRTAARALGSGLRETTDVVARVGGDEFGVLVPRVADAAGLVRRLRAALAEAVTPDGLPVRASVGAASAEPGDPVQRVVERADREMYADKRSRRG
ncbi:diguanylate cyclase domain-containing protein [Quadrisphaera sp. GCM10027208]|uniref:GGDEF domain-containing protein n=1 Tax=Quadrisphaera sp. GCM10027208 TaxID=3273423 RepID=UPI003621B70F